MTREPAPPPPEGMTPGLPDSNTFFVMVGPTRVRVRTVGTGPPLMMIMGIGGNLDMWTPLAKRLSGRELIMFDFPGTGGSSMSWLPPTMGANALLVKALLRKLGHETVDVLGYSWGGMLAQHLAIQHPKLVRRLVLACTTIGWGGVPPGPRVTARMLTPRRYYSRTYFAKIAPEIYGGRFRDDPGLVTDEVNRRVGRPPGYLGYAAQLLALGGYSTLPALGRISACTLVLAGDDDPIVATANQKIMARRIKRSELRIVPGSGHLLLIESPQLAASLILEFLGRAERP